MCESLCHSRSTTHLAALAMTLRDSNLTALLLVAALANAPARGAADLHGCILTNLQVRGKFA